MINKIIFCALFAMACSSAVFAQDSEQIKKLPPLKALPKQSIDVKHIALDLRFDWQKKQARGSATITFTPLTATDNISLDATMLDIQSIALSNGAGLQYQYNDGNKDQALAIKLDRIYRTDENVSITIIYNTRWINQPDPNSLNGSNGKGLRFSAPTSNDPNKPYEIWSMGDPQSNRYWFPGNDTPNDLRTSEFTATVDKNLTVISNGVLVETRENADDTRTFHYKAAIPYANHLTSFVVGEFVDIR
jgi:aminopeptidase N